MSNNFDFFQPFTKIVIPIAVQNVFVSSLGIIDTVMVGQLGEGAIAAVNLANQVFFLLNFFLFGINTGAAVFTAQYWGKRDQPGIRRVVGICLILGGSITVIFLVIALGFPYQFLQLYTQDLNVLQPGRDYLFIVGFSYIATMLTLCFTTNLRSVGVIRFPVIISIISLCLNTGMNYVLIFGYFGFPALGVRGAALSTLIARILECGSILLFAYKKQTPVAGSFKELFDFDLHYWKVYLAVAAPVFLNEVFWSIGTSFYQAIYARVGTDQIAAVSVANMIMTLASVLFVGITSACGILIGNSIGEGKPEKAYKIAKQSILFSVGVFVIIFFMIIILRDATLTLFNLSATSRSYAYDVLTIMSFALIFRAVNPVIIVGTLRSGGDTVFSALLDVAAVWLVGVPLAYIGAFIFHLPIHWVVACAYGEGLFKMIIGLHRIASKKWIRNLVH